MPKLPNFKSYLRAARLDAVSMLSASGAGHGQRKEKLGDELKAPDEQNSPTNRASNMARTPEPAIFVIFGITGDLAHKKLLPALYHLMKDDLLSEHTAIVGVSRREMSAADLLKKVELCVLEADSVCDPKAIAKLRKRLHMLKLNPLDGEDYKRLHAALDGIEDKEGLCMNRLYYLAIPPQVYSPVIENLGLYGLNAGCQHHRAVSRLLVEKPFGYDLVSATELIADTSQQFSEEQVFRIDHYLAKETAQNILVFRRHNPIFASLWNNKHVTAIDLLFSEQIGVEGRAEFYDNVGALRDVVQNHLLQLLALTTMELPHSSDPDSLHAAKQKLLATVSSVDPNQDHVIRGQYKGYEEEVNNIGSTTETYVSLCTDIDDERWRGVPITLSAGKALDVKTTRITLTFADASRQGSTNRLTFRITPNEGIDLVLTVKQPGFEERTETTHMDFSYRSAFGDHVHPDAYERVLVDAVRGDHSLFATSKEVLESWRIVQPILSAWAQDSDDLLYYEPGSTGPDATA